MLNVAAALVERTDFCQINVDPVDLEADIGEAQRKRESDITHADYDDRSSTIGYLFD